MLPLLSTRPHQSDLYTGAGCSTHIGGSVPDQSSKQSWANVSTYCWIQRSQHVGECSCRMPALSASKTLAGRLLQPLTATAGCLVIASVRLRSHIFASAFCWVRPSGAPVQDVQAGKWTHKLSFSWLCAASWINCDRNTSTEHITSSAHRQCQMVAGARP